MKRKTRLIILLICVVLFLVIAPYIVLYSLGYRVDFAHYKITATGGIYVRVYPTGANVSIDNTTKETTSYFYSSVFVQNLTPGTHQVSVSKDGYYDYAKTLPVAENEVTKLENITLFKKDIAFTPFLLPPNQTAKTQFALLAIPPVKDAQLSDAQKTAMAAKNIVAHSIDGNTLLWLQTDGLLYRSDLDGTNQEALSTVPLKISKTTAYDLESVSGNIFLEAGTDLLQFNKTATAFGLLGRPVDGVKASPDSQKVVYYNANEIDYITPNIADSKAITLRKSLEPISQVAWLNNDYVIFSEGNNIVISEIDIRGNTNTVTLPANITLGTQTVAIKSPQFFFNQQDKKLYLLTQNNLVVSDRLLP